MRLLRFPPGHRFRNLLFLPFLTLATVLSSLPLAADVVETFDGSTIRGRLIASDAGVIKIETEFAGTISIRQDQVKVLTTDTPLYVALTDGVTINGRIEPRGTGLRIAGATEVYTAEPAEISAVWREGDKSPAERAADALRRKWGYELAFDLNGRSGNRDRTFVGMSGRAVLEGAIDRLILNGNYARSEENGETAEDAGKAGIDYSNFFRPKTSWYVRSLVGYDGIKDLDLRAQAAVGFGYTFIKDEIQKLEGRFGVSYRSEDYGDPTSDDVNAAGMDLGLLHTLNSPWGRLTQSLSITPSFRDLSEYVLVHDSTLELPVTTDKPWRVRVGIRTDYNNAPPPGFERLDWTYFSQLVLTWK